VLRCRVFVCHYKPAVTCTVDLLPQVPEQTAKADIQQSAGKAKYDAKRNAIIWKIKRFNGAQVPHSMAFQSSLKHCKGKGVCLVVTS
jgi:hypothetical protein